MNQIWSRSWSSCPLLILGASLASCVTTGGEAEVATPVPPRPTPAQETQAVIGAVNKSGEVPADIQPVLQKAAASAFDETFGAPSPDLVQVQSMGCFASGCLFQVTYRDRCVELAFKKRLTDAANARLRSWPGTIYQTPPVALRDGRVQVTWTLLIADSSDRRARLDALLKPAMVPAATIKPDICAAVSAAANQDSTPAQGIK
jgi:hypothetical protein